jgi:hypothetical protein
LNNSLDFKQYINNLSFIHIILSCKKLHEVCNEFKSFYQLSAIPLLLTTIDEDALRSAPGAALLKKGF